MCRKKNTLLKKKSEIRFEKKSLGIFLNYRLTLDNHFKKLRKKISFIKSKLFNVLTKSSLRFRRNSFQIFICPLFHQLNSFLVFSKATDKNTARGLWKKSLKSFVGLKYKTKDSDLKLFLPYDFLHKMKTDLNAFTPKVSDRICENLDTSVLQKQKLLRLPIEPITNPLEKNPLDEITTIINIIDRKKGRRIKTSRASSTTRCQW